MKICSIRLVSFTGSDSNRLNVRGWVASPCYRFARIVCAHAMVVCSCCSVTPCSRPHICDRIRRLETTDSRDERSHSRSCKRRHLFQWNYGRRTGHHLVSFCPVDGISSICDFTRGCCVRSRSTTDRWRAHIDAHYINVMWQLRPRQSADDITTLGTHCLAEERFIFIGAYEYTIMLKVIQNCIYLCAIELLASHANFHFWFWFQRFRFDFAKNESELIVLNVIFFADSDCSVIRVDCVVHGPAVQQSIPFEKWVKFCRDATCFDVIRRLK